MKILIVAAFHSQESTEENNFSFKKLELDLQTIANGDTETLEMKSSETLAKKESDSTFAGVPFVNSNSKVTEKI
jgi:hypothetical protein